MSIIIFHLIRTVLAQNSIKILHKIVNEKKKNKVESIGIIPLEGRNIISTKCKLSQ